MNTELPDRFYCISGANLVPSSLIGVVLKLHSACFSLESVSAQLEAVLSWVF